MNATQKEAQEIITNVTADLRAGRCEFWQWWDMVHKTLTHVYAKMIEAENDTR